MRVLIVSHSAVAGGSNNTIGSLLRQAPPGLEARCVYMEDGPWLERCPVPCTLIDAGRARQFWKAPGAIRRLRAEIRAFDADLVFAHVTKAHLYASIAARLERVPYMWWQQERFGQRPIMHSISGRLPAAAVICSAEHTAAEQRRRFPRTPVARIHLGIPVDRVGEPHRHRPGPVTLGVVGRLQRWKRVELAIRAMPRVLELAPGTRLRVVGDAFPGLDEDYPGELRAEAQRLGVADQVEFTGEVADGMAEIADLDVLVHCAEIEPFGLVPIEGMVWGVPVVVPDEGGPVETVREGVDGLRVDPRDSEALAQAIASLANDPARRAAMGAAGRERVLEHFTEQRMARQAWELAARVAAARPPLDG